MGVDDIMLPAGPRDAHKRGLSFLMSIRCVVYVLSNT